MGGASACVIGDVCMRNAVVSDSAQFIVCWSGVVVKVAVRSELSG